MALVNTLPFLVTFRFVDNNLKASNVSFNLAATVDTVAEVITAANALRDVIIPVVNARLEGASATVLLTENDPLTPIPAESEVERKLVIDMQGANRRARASFLIPSPVFTVEQNGTDVVAPSAAITALVEAIAAQAVTTHGAALVELAGPIYIDHRNRERSR